MSEAAPLLFFLCLKNIKRGGSLRMRPPNVVFPLFCGVCMFFGQNHLRHKGATQLPLKRLLLFPSTESGHRRSPWSPWRRRRRLRVTHILWMDEILRHLEIIASHCLLVFTGESSVHPLVLSATRVSERWCRISCIHRRSLWSVPHGFFLVRNWLKAD